MGIYKDTVGLNLILELGEDLSGATDIVLNVKKPDGEWYQWSGAIVQNTTQLIYATQSGDLDQDGNYIIYPSLTVGAWTGRGNHDRFLVRDHLKPDKNYRI